MTQPVEHYYGDGCPDDSAAHWRDLCDAMGREVIRLQDQASIARRERDQHEKDVRAAAKSAAWQSALFNTRLYLKREVTGEIDGLLYRLDHLPEKLTKSDIQFLQWVGRDLRNAIGKFDPEGSDGAVAEIRRLRAAFQAQGRQMHAEYGPTEGPRCGCPGCELVRAIDLHETAEVAA